MNLLSPTRHEFQTPAGRAVYTAEHGESAPFHSVKHCYRAGMPQLSYFGLAENWLLKECGDRHWAMLAIHSGRRVPEFIADNSNRAYAAFTAVRLYACTFQELRENDEFDIRTTLHRVGATRHVSEHQILRGDTLYGKLTMASMFVMRNEAGNNRTVTRATLASLAGEVSPAPEAASQMFLRSKQLRSGEVPRDWLVGEQQQPPEARAEFIPCPHNDFNGAGFLYFASFQAFIDRAEWQRHRFADPPALSSRELFFYGNINVQDTLAVTFLHERVDGHGLTHWAEVTRGSDGQKIADILTKKCWRR
ncbi:hypothetical protein HJC00_27820 [Rhizobium sp. NLR22b]|nr:hypothetical protein [Rhizobium sp. NLR22b]